MIWLSTFSRKRFQICFFCCFKNKQPNMGLTNGASCMRAHKVGLGLGDGSHAYLVEGPSEEGSKGTAEHHVTVPAGQPDGHAHHVLLRYEALDEAVWELVPVGDSKGGVLRVAVQSNEVGVGVPQLHQGCAVRLASGYLFVWRRQIYRM